MDTSIRENREGLYCDILWIPRSWGSRGIILWYIIWIPRWLRTERDYIVIHYVDTSVFEDREGIRVDWYMWNLVVWFAICEIMCWRALLKYWFCYWKGFTILRRRSWWIVIERILWIWKFLWFDFDLKKAKFYKLLLIWLWSSFIDWLLVGKMRKFTDFVVVDLFMITYLGVRLNYAFDTLEKGFRRNFFWKKNGKKISYVKCRILSIINVYT